MSATGSRSRVLGQALWAAFAAVNLYLVATADDWETLPFHLVWVSLAVGYGFWKWKVKTAILVLALVSVVSGLALLEAISREHGPGVDELVEVPLMAAMFLAMLWHSDKRERALDEVARAAEAERRLRDRQEEFVRDVSHGLRTPISIAKGHAELIRDSSDRQTSGDAQVIVEELDRLARTTDQLLILAAAEHPSFLVREPVQLGAFVRETVRRWRPAAGRAWSAEVLSTGWVEADEERLRVAVDALIENAVHHTDEGDPIVLRVDGRAGKAVLEVSDAGTGIPPDQLDRVFVRYARGEGPKPRERPGVGLGLSIVRAVVEAHGGHVEVESVLGAGTTMRMVLPGFRPSNVEPAEAMGAAAAAGPPV